MDDLGAKAPVEATPEDTSLPVDDQGNPIMHIKIYSPFKTYYDETGRSISAENETGPFDILPHHHNFITLLSACEMAVQRLDKTVQRIRISGGIMHVKADRVIVFLDV